MEILCCITMDNNSKDHKICDLNKNEVQLVEKNNKGKCVCGLIGICVLLLICVVILVGWIRMKSAKDNSLCNDAIQNCNSTITNESQIDSIMEKRRQFVREMMIDAWSAYEQYAWGHDELSPVIKKFYRERFGNYSGLSIIASMSSFWIMELKEEFEQGKEWIETELDLAMVDEEVQVSDVIVNYVGGLLSCYALTNETLFLNKALTIAQLVEPAFTTSTELPYRDINLNSIETSLTNSSLSSVSGFLLDFNYLSDLSGDDKYRKQIEKIQDVLKTTGNPNNLNLNKTKGKSDCISLFDSNRNFYIYLVKSFIQSNYLDEQSIEMYSESLYALERVKIFEVSPGGLYYTRDHYGDSNSHWYNMSYSNCYLGAMLSLGASAMQRALALNSSIDDKDKVTQQNRINRHWHLADEITETCQQASVRTKTGLGPDWFYYNLTHDVIPDQYFDRYFLSPELAESNFILWRLTHNEKYRDNAWQMAQAIHRHCRVEGGGYGVIKGVNEVQPDQFLHDKQPAIFLSATLKYLFLTFTNDSVLSLDKFVFNSVGHPLPICGNNAMYPAELCNR